MPEDAPAPAPTSDLAEIARKVTVGRKIFEELYDSAVEARIAAGLAATPAAEPPWQFKTLALYRNHAAPGLLGAAKDQADFAEALLQAHRQGWLVTFFAAHADKLFAGADQGDLRIALQSVVNVAEIFRDPQTVTTGAIVAMRRCCKIICERAGEAPETGSGFLIGPHLVLTNWHVVRSQLEPDGCSEAADSHRRIRVQFDYLADNTKAPTPPFGVRRKWLVAHSQAHPAELGLSLAQGEAPWADDPDAFSQYDDFAVLELDRTPGYDRGWYALDEARPPTPGTKAIVYQFPGPLALRCTSGDFIAPTLFPTGDPARIQHTANTIGGSSGGLCLDSGMNAVALHQAGWNLAQDPTTGLPTAAFNAAIPLHRIARRAAAAVNDKIRAAPQGVTITPTGDPIIGRPTLQAMIDEARRGDIRVLVVQTSWDQAQGKPRSRIGKSFTRSILRTMLPAADHLVLDVPAIRLTTDSYNAARAIVEVVDPRGQEQLPSAPTLSAFDAETVAGLAEAVVAVMLRAAGSGVLWLMIDDLDRYRVMAESPAAAFLGVLYRRMAAEERLRLVLVGPTSELPALAGLNARVEKLEEHLSDQDVAIWIDRRRGQERPFTPDARGVLVSVARSVSRKLADDPATGQTGAIAGTLKNHLDPSIYPGTAR